jgi:hypothetical protein
MLGLPSLVYFLVEPWIPLSERDSIAFHEEAMKEGEDNSTAVELAADQPPEGCLPSSNHHLLLVEVPWSCFSSPPKIDW